MAKKKKDKFERLVDKDIEKGDVGFAGEQEPAPEEKKEPIAEEKTQPKPTSDNEKRGLPAIKRAVTTSTTKGMATKREPAEAPKTTDVSPAKPLKLNTRGGIGAVERRVDALPVVKETVDEEGIPLSQEEVVKNAANVKKLIAQSKSKLGLISREEAIEETDKANEAQEKAPLIKAADKILKVIGLGKNEELPPNITAEEIRDAKMVVEDDIMSGDRDAMARMENINRALQRSRKSEPAIEKLGLQDYYPEINEPIRVGQYQGSIVGSVPIFVSKGGYLPMGIVDARKRALEAAAKEKAKEKAAFMKMLFLQGANQYQNEIDDRMMNLFEESGSGVGWDVSKLTDLTDPAGRKFMESYLREKQFAQQTLEMNKVATEIIEAANKNDQSVPPEMLKEAYDWLSASTEKGISYFAENPKELAKHRNKMRSYQSMVSAVGTQMPRLTRQIVPMMMNGIENALAAGGKQADDVRDAIMTINQGADYNTIMSATKKFISDEQLEAFVEGIYGDGNFYQSKEEMAKYVRSMMPDQIDLKTQIAKKYNMNAIRARAEATEKTTIWNQTEKALTNNRKGIFGGIQKAIIDAGWGKKNWSQLSDNEKATYTKKITEVFNNYAENRAIGDGTLRASAHGATSRMTGATRPLTGSEELDYMRVGIAGGKLLEPTPENEALWDKFSSANTQYEVSSVSEEWRYRGDDGKLKVVSAEDLYKNPDIANRLVPAATVKYRVLNPWREMSNDDIEALNLSPADEEWAKANKGVYIIAPKSQKALVAEQTYDLTNMGDKAHLDALEYKEQTQARAARNKKTKEEQQGDDELTSLPPLYTSNRE